MAGKARTDEDETAAPDEATDAEATGSAKNQVVVWKGHQFPFDEREFTALDFRTMIGTEDDEEPVKVPLFLRFNAKNNWSVPMSQLDFLPEDIREAWLLQEEDLEVVEVDR